MKKNKRIPSRIIWLLIPVLILIFSFKTNFNLAGYSYVWNEETDIITIKTGYFKKEVYHIQMDDDNTSGILSYIIFPIDQANSLWVATISIVVLFVQLLIGSLRKTKKSKLYILIYCVLLSVFIIWDMKFNQELIERISMFVNKLEL